MSTLKEKYNKDPIGIDIDGEWITRAISRVIRFIGDPLCDHLEVDTNGIHPMAYVLSEDGYVTLEAYNWDVVTYECATNPMKDFIVELHMENQECELLNWHVDNP